MRVEKAPRASQCLRGSLTHDRPEQRRVGTSPAGEGRTPAPSAHNGVAHSRTAEQVGHDLLRSRTSPPPLTRDAFKRSLSASSDPAGGSRTAWTGRVSTLGGGGFPLCGRAPRLIRLRLRLGCSRPAQRRQPVASASDEAVSSMPSRRGLGGRAPRRCVLEAESSNRAVFSTDCLSRVGAPIRPRHSIVTGRLGEDIPRKKRSSGGGCDVPTDSPPSARGCHRIGVSTALQREESPPPAGRSPSTR